MLSLSLSRSPPLSLPSPLTLPFFLPFSRTKYVPLFCIEIAAISEAQLNNKRGKRKNASFKNNFTAS